MQNKTFYICNGPVCRGKTLERTTENLYFDNKGYINGCKKCRSFLDMKKRNPLLTIEDWEAFKEKSLRTPQIGFKFCDGVLCNGIEVPLSDFSPRYVNAEGKQIYEPLCRKCSLYKQQIWCKENPGKYQQWYENRLQKYYGKPNRYVFWKKRLLQEIKKRCKRNNLPMMLTEDDIPELPAYCPIFGIPIIENPSMDERENGPSIDKINPLGCYTRNNIQVISYKANRAKNNSSLDELILMGKWAEQIKITHK